MQERQQFIDVFMNKNSQLNLSAIRDADWIYNKHIRDAIELDQCWKIPEWSFVGDLGTGGGIPLIPLAIMHPECHFLGVDGTRKKIDAINDMVAELWISNCKAVWSRWEDLGMDFDVVTARAVTYIDKLLPIIDTMIHKWSYIVLYKQDKKEELSDLRNLLHKYKLRMVKQHRYKLFDEDIDRVIYVLVKN